MIGRVFLLPLPSVIEEYEKEEDAAADAEAEQRPPIHAQHPPVGLSLKKRMMWYVNMMTPKRAELLAKVQHNYWRVGPIHF